jgi:hypothetical protein
MIMQQSLSFLHQQIIELVMPVSAARIIPHHTTAVDSPNSYFSLLTRSNAATEALTVKNVMVKGISKLGRFLSFLHQQIIELVMPASAARIIPHHTTAVDSPNNHFSLLTRSNAATEALTVKNAMVKGMPSTEVKQAPHPSTSVKGSASQRRHALQRLQVPAILAGLDSW